MQVGDVKGLRVQDADVARPQAMGQALEFRQDARAGRVQTGGDEDVSEVYLGGRNGVD